MVHIAPSPNHGTYLRLHLHLHLHERTHLDTAQEKRSTDWGRRIHPLMATCGVLYCPVCSKGCRGMGFGSGTSHAPVIKPIGASCALDVMSGWPVCVDVDVNANVSVVF